VRSLLIYSTVMGIFGFVTIFYFERCKHYQIVSQEMLTKA
jgi:hypothetical protein